MKTLLLTLLPLVGCSSTTRTAPAVEAADAFGAAPGAFLALSVADMDRVLPFYRDTLGFKVFSEGTAPHRPIRFALLQHGTALIELLQFPDAKPLKEAAPDTPYPHQIHGFFKGGFVVADIDSLYRKMQSMNVERSYELGKSAGGPYRTFGIRDPEGNLLQIFGR